MLGSGVWCSNSHFILKLFNRLKPGIHKSHKGPHTTTSLAVTSAINSKTKTSRTHAKLSTQRLAQLRGSGSADALAHAGTYHDVIKRSKDLRTPEEVSAVLPWVCTISHQHCC